VRVLAAAFAAVVGLLTATPGPVPATTLPPPEAVIGFPACSDRQLATYEQIADYFKALALASQRIAVVDIGETTEGRRQLMALISSEANLDERLRYRDISTRLARARGLSDEEAGRLADEGRAIVMIDFGLHSTEVAAAQAAALLAYHAVGDETPEVRFIRENVILLLVPNMNPDGTTLVAKWYMDNRGTALETSPPPTLYHRYAGHDNNRDWFMFNLAESRNVARQLYGEWLPQIVHDHHQTPPFPARIFIPPFAAPTNPHIPNPVLAGTALVGDAMRARFAHEKRLGAVSGVQFDTWWNGGMRTAPYFHNMVGILTETAHSSPLPQWHDGSTFPKAFADGISTTEPSRLYPLPYPGGLWRMRDSCDLMVSASMAVLDIGARRRRAWLYDMYQMGRDAIRSGTDEYYVVPADQWDDAAAVRMVNALLAAGIEVSQALEPFEANGERFAEGTFIIPAAQPFAAYVRDLMEPQVYPDSGRLPAGPPVRPYDLTGWTLPMQMGVRVKRIDGSLHVGQAPIAHATSRPRAIGGADGEWLAIDPRSSRAFTVVNRLLASGAPVWRAGEPVGTGDLRWPAGAFFARRGSSVERIVNEAARHSGLPVRALNRDERELSRVERPRTGLYRTWGGNTDEGWTRWVLEQHEFPFNSLLDSDIRAGELRARFDVVILPHASYDGMVGGHPEAAGAAAGGMTKEGAQHLGKFVRAGGTLIALGSASDLPIQLFGESVRNLSDTLKPTEFLAPGTLVRLSVDSRHPLAYGVPEQAIAFYADGPVFDIGPSDRPPSKQPNGLEPGRLALAATFAQTDLLASGWLVGGDWLSGRPAVLEVPHGRGRAILFGFRPQHRGQTDQTFKFLFNAILRGAVRGP
jgi:hypothetical protein